MNEIRRTRRQCGTFAAGAVALVAALGDPAVLHADGGRAILRAVEPGDGPGTAMTSPAAPSMGASSPEKSRQTLRRLTEPGAYWHAFATLMAGDGLRFNNPYRLTRQLGQTGESLSLTAPYVDVALVVATGSPTGLAHGGRLSWSVAMSGVPQGAVTPAYLAAWRPSGEWLFYAWLGIPFLTAPDLNVGGELALAGTYFVRAGIGASAALVADGFYGAGTRETRAAFYPVLSAQLGLSVNYEVLP